MRNVATYPSVLIVIVINSQGNALGVRQDTGVTTVKTDVIFPIAIAPTAIKVMVSAVYARRTSGAISVTVHAILKNVQGFLNVRNKMDQFASIA